MIPVDLPQRLCGGSNKTELLTKEGSVSSRASVRIFDVGPSDDPPYPAAFIPDTVTKPVAQGSIWLVRPPPYDQLHSMAKAVYLKSSLRSSAAALPSRL